MSSIDLAPPRPPLPDNDLQPASDDPLLAELEEVYAAKERANDFKDEKPIYAALLPKLRTELKGFELIRPFSLGSTATVWEVRDTGLGHRRAMKLARPTRKLSNIIRVIRGEKERLASLTHQNLTKIYFSSEVSGPVGGEVYELPFFLMEFLDGVKDFDEYLYDHADTLKANKVIEYIRDVLTGLAYLHDQKDPIYHLDIKPGNMLIAHGKPALIGDLGYSKQVFPAMHRDSMTSVTFTLRYAHPELREQLQRMTDTNAAGAEVQWKNLRPGYDLFSLGRALQEILSELRRRERAALATGRRTEPLFTPYQWRYLSLIAIRLLDGVVEHQDTDTLRSDVLPGLPASVMQELKYARANEALEDVEKAANLYDLEGIIPELNPNIGTYIQIPCAKVSRTPRVDAIIEHPRFARLGQVTQLGFVSLVYPGAAHTRLEHVLGTFAHCCELVRALWYDQTNCLFRSLMSKAHLETVLVAALVHDIGQYPMGHDLAEIDSHFAHELFTKDALTAIETSTETYLSDVIESGWETTTKAILGVLNAKSDSPFRDRILKSLVNGPLDADKLDYLRRDSVHCGVLFGSGVDQERLYRNLTLVYASDGRGTIEAAEIGVTEKALVIAESIWRARRDMFRQVYWHHTVRGLKAMLAYAVRNMLMRMTEEEQTTFWRRMQQFVLTPLAAYAPQAPAATHLTASDDALIAFLATFAEGPERNMLEMIRERKLYGRIGVVSHRRSPHHYASIYDSFRSDRLNGHLEHIEEARLLWEEAIIEAVLDKAGPADRVAVEDTLRGVTPLLLVDVPVKALKKRGREEAIWFIPEDELELPEEPAITFPSAAKAAIQIEQSTFDKETGKIRVLAHPDVQAIITRYLSSDNIADLVAA